MNTGRPFEILNKLLQECLKDIPGTIIEQNKKLKDKYGKDREFDVVISSSISGMEILILVECKDYKGKVAMEKIEAFNSKCATIPGVSKKVFVASNGYQSGAIENARGFDIELYTLKDLDSHQVRKWIETFGLKAFTLNSCLVAGALRFGEGHSFDSEEELEIMIGDYGPISEQDFYQLLTKMKQKDFSELGYHLHMKIEAQVENLNSFQVQVWQDLPPNFVYVKSSGRKIFVNDVRFDIKYSPEEKVLSPRDSKSYSSDGTEKAEILTFDNVIGRERITMVKDRDNPQKINILITAPDGNPLDLKDAPKIFLPDGMDVKTDQSQFLDSFVSKPPESLNRFFSEGE